MPDMKQLRRNGQEAIRLAKEHIPALILIDNRMPVMDGITATKILKAEPTTAKIPIIATTASAMKGDRERIMSEAVDEYVPKPIEIANAGTYEHSQKISGGINGTN